MRILTSRSRASPSCSLPPPPFPPPRWERTGCSSRADAESPSPGSSSPDRRGGRDVAPIPEMSDVGVERGHGGAKLGPRQQPSVLHGLAVRSAGDGSDPRRLKNFFQNGRSSKRWRAAGMPTVRSSPGDLLQPRPKRPPALLEEVEPRRVVLDELLRSRSPSRRGTR